MYMGWREELIHNGLRIAIVGCSNAGKLSLLNLLLVRDTVAVYSMPGTTKDVVKVILDLEGVRFTLLETDGVREEEEESMNNIEV